MLGVSLVARLGRAVAVSGLVASGWLLFGAGGAQASNPACPAASSSTATSCTFTSGTPLFTVPAGVGGLDVVAVGAAGGSGYGPWHAVPACNCYEDGAGGLGASVEDQAVPAVPGTILGVYVGTVGSSSGSGSGGIPGGGAGGADQIEPPGGYAAGGGGGFSGLEAPDGRLLVAAGGGGGGGEGVGQDQAGAGGTGDTGSGGGAGHVAPYFSGSSGGGGGSASGGGAAGTLDNRPGACTTGASPATAGSAEQGGAGIAYGLSGYCGSGAGGGGGGGYNGGGGGGANPGGSDPDGSGGGGPGNGGGGGGSYGVSGLTNGHVTSDPASVTISWAVPSYLKSFGGSGSGDGQFGGPVGIAVDPSNGVMYVADQAHSRIEVFDPNDNFLFSFATSAPPSGIAGDFSSSPGTLFVTEPGAPGGVEMFDGAGDNLGYVTQVPGSGTPLLTGVAVDPSNQTVYVTDSGNNQVDMYDESGNLTGRGTFNGSDSATALSDPTGVAVDPGRGRVYVADAGNQRVAVFDLTGNSVSAFGSGGSGAGQFGLPDGVAVQPGTGDVFVVDRGNDRVESFAADGTYINSFGAAGSGNGQFDSPWGVAFASDGSFFVTDTSNDRVEKFGQAVIVPPTAGFSAAQDSGSLKESFTDSSSAVSPSTVTGWSWNFGDGSGTSTAQDPSYTYAQAGSYQVSLTVTDSNGETNTSTQTVVVNAPPTAGFSAAQDSGSLKESFTDSSSAVSPATVTGWSWNFGDGGGTSTAQDPSYTYAQAGSYQVSLTVTDSNGETGTSTQTVVVNAAPTVSSVSPRSGSTAGGTAVTISGTGFVPGAIVKFGTAAASSVTFVSATELQATAPAHAAGTVNVTVHTGGGTSAVATADEYSYGAPTVSSVSPRSGSTAGGTAVTISGTGFVPGATVKFGTAAASSVTFVSATELNATAPAHAAGTVDVTVSTPGGTSATSRLDQYAYGAPSVSAVNPTVGPTAGGNTVTITGTNFVAGATVDFGANAGTSVDVESSTKLTAVAPAGSYGTVDVTVGTAGGTSATSSADHYGYGQPSVSAVSPSSGPGNGGKSVTITGTNFAAGATVQFGSAAATSVQFSSSTQLIATAPPGTGTVDVTVTTPQGGTSATSAADHYSYIDLASPTVTAVSPHSGSVDGSEHGHHHGGALCLRGHGELRGKCRHVGEPCVSFKADRGRAGRPRRHGRCHRDHAPGRDEPDVVSRQLYLPAAGGRGVRR